jgi:hypothetical protein
VDIEVPNGVDKSQFAEEDIYYAGTSFILRGGRFPRTVATWNGRLIFGGCYEAPQRIFASKVNDMNNFSTYTKVVTETREYFTVYGTLDTAAGTFKPDSDTALSQFTRPMEDYYVKNDYYPDEARVKGYFGDRLYLIGGGKSLVLTLEEKMILNNWYLNMDTSSSRIYDINNMETDDYAKKYADAVFLMFNAIKVFVLLQTMAINDTGKGEDNDGIREQKVYDIPDELVRDVCLEYPAPTALDTWVKGIIGGREKIEKDDEYAAFITDFKNYIWNTMQYTLHGTTYYGTVYSIRRQILGNERTNIHAYIPFYSKDYLVEKIVTAEDGFMFDLGSDIADPIKWLSNNKHLVVGTESGEWVIPAGTTATNIQAALNSRYGSDSIPAIAAGGAMVFVQNGKRAAIEYYIPQDDSYFRVNNMAMLNQGILADSPVTGLDFVSSPHTKLFFTRKDGTIAALLYDRSTGTFAWGRITAGGKILSAVTLPGPNGLDEMYMVVERQSGSGALYNIERFDDRDSVFLDAYSTYDNYSHYSYDPDKARVLDMADGAMYTLNEAPQPSEFDPSHRVVVGYPYTSIARSMPVLSNDRMKPTVIKNLLVRFHNSYLPVIKSLPNEAVEVVNRDEPYNGVIKIPFPGSWETDVFFEIIHDKPNTCHILAVNAEAN